MRPDDAAGKNLSAASVGLAVALIGIGVLHLAIGDLTWWGECITVWPTIGWLILLTPRLVIWMMRRQWRDAVLVGGLAVALVLVTGEWRSLFRRAFVRPAEKNAGDVRLVTWNVAGGMPLRDIGADGPDLALLQEIGGLPSTLVRPEGLKGFQWLADFDPGTLSRFPIERLPTRRIGPWQEPQMLRTFVAGRKVLLINVRMMLPAFVIAVASFESPSALVRMHAERVGQFVLLRDLISETLRNEATTTAILCGDFNSPGGIQSSLPLTTIMRDVWPEGGRGWGSTMTSWFPVSRIDQCWVTPDVEVRNAEVRRGESDHRRLVVDLVLK